MAVKKLAGILSHRMFCVILFLGLVTPICQAQEITVAAAADLQFAMQEIAAKFQSESGKTIKIIYGSSGTFFQQIQNGAPFDMFFSANVDYPRQLEAAGLVETGSIYLYARGKIVLWVPKESKVELGQGLRALLDPAVKKIAIANPMHAPYGQAAVSAMKKEGVYERVKGKFVLGENISQTASFVTSGAADVGLIALSLAVSPNMQGRGRYSDIPANEYEPINQACVILRSSKNKTAAEEFLSFVKEAAASDLLKKYGFEAATSPAR